MPSVILRVPRRTRKMSEYRTVPSVDAIRIWKVCSMNRKNSEFERAHRQQMEKELRLWIDWTNPTSKNICTVNISVRPTDQEWSAGWGLFRITLGTDERIKPTYETSQNPTNYNGTAANHNGLSHSHHQRIECVNSNSSCEVPCREIPNLHDES